MPVINQILSNHQLYPNKAVYSMLVVVVVVIVIVPIPFCFVFRFNMIYLSVLSFIVTSYVPNCLSMIRREREKKKRGKG